MLDKKLPEFPIKTIPSSIIESKSYHFIVGDFPDYAHVNELFRMMFEKTECDFFYFGEQGKPIDAALEKAKNDGDLLIVETQFYWYKHPNAANNKDFVRIEKPIGDYRWEWQKEVVEKGPMFMRMKLKLANKKRTEFEIWKKVQIEDSFRDHMLKQRKGCDVFLSCSAKDAELAEQIYDAIRVAGGKVFLAKKSIEPGSEFAEEIRNALKESTDVWLLVSPNSVKSAWVISEWGAAWVLKKRIVPILYRISPDELPDRLRQFQCIDFHEYQKLINDNFPKAKRKNDG